MRRSLILVLTLLLSACGGGGSSNSPLKKTTAAEKRDDAARVHVELGQRYMQQGKLDIAMEKLEKALELSPNFPDAHTVIAVLYERIGDTKDAEIHYHRAVDLQPKLGGPNNNYGQILCNLGRYDEADKYFQRAMTDPFYKTPDLAMSNAGVCLLRGNRLDQAEAYFRRAIELNPANSTALFQLANALYRKNDYFKARAFVQRFEAQGQESAESLMLAHDIEIKLGNSSAARDYARRLRQQYPDSQQVQQLDSSNPS